ncbi:hypothetical protein AAL_07776 [Moelleriella libera RCEF 2490]|uniref:Uncharacterized protein n=1 Tax=Moelleriella libera RCEF 2490 TaxID=1081109 RepID=A0A167WPT6_9HYPO|nr:hypothetical protein AAL_07776 [Moelleriella libera RCEF 2490]
MTMEMGTDGAETAELLLEEKRHVRVTIAACMESTSGFEEERGSVEAGDRLV